MGDLRGNTLVLRDVGSKRAGPSWYSETECGDLVSFHDHLLPVLAIFRHGRSQYALYPCASGDLRHLWKVMPHPEMEIDTVRWVSTQLVGILGAVHALVPLPRYYDYDIPHPGKILWFESFGHQGKLVLSDMVLASFVTEYSSLPSDLELPREREIDYGAPRTSTYWRANWSQGSTWTCGCVFLEILTWLLGGKALVDEFEKHLIASIDRLTSSSLDITFFETREYGADEMTRVRPQVTEVSPNSLPILSLFYIPSRPYLTYLVFSIPALRRSLHPSTLFCTPSGSMFFMHTHGVHSSSMMLLT